MFNPIETIQKIKSRFGKPIRPIIELQKEGSIVNIVTNTIQTENMIQDTFRNEAWELAPDVPASAIYIDGVFRGMGFFAGEEGQILKVKKDVTLYEEVLDENKRPVMKDGKPLIRQAISASFKGLFSKLLDASLIEKGSALKPSLTQTIIYCLLVSLVAFMLGMSYGR